MTQSSHSELVEALREFVKIGVEHLDGDAGSTRAQRIAPLLSLTEVRKRAESEDSAACYRALDEIIEKRLALMADEKTASALKILYGYEVRGRKASWYERRRRPLRVRADEAGHLLGVAGGYNTLRRRGGLDRLHGTVAHLLLGEGPPPPPSDPRDFRERAQRVTTALTQVFADVVGVLALWERMPSTVAIGDLNEMDVPDPVRKDIQRLRKSLSRNEGVALVDLPNDFDPNQPIAYRGCDYATWLAWSRHPELGSQAPAVLSASHLLTDSAEHHLLLFRRSSLVQTWPGALCLPGGTMITAREGGSMPFDETLAHTAQREVREELGPFKSFDKPEVALIAHDRLVNRLEVAGLGGHGIIRTGEPTDRFEGTPEPLDLGGLEQLLKQGERWSPVARIHVMAWLGLGAPSSTRALADTDAINLFEELVGWVGRKQDHRTEGWHG